MQRKTVNTENYELSKAQDLLNQSITEVQSKIPFFPRNIFDVALSTSDTTIEHKLNKAYTGYLVLALDAAQVVYTSPTSNSNPSLYLILRAGGSVNAKVMVF